MKAQTMMKPPLAEQAVILGGSMAGLLAARVLARRFRRVSVIERDVRPAPRTARKGVPQGEHVHILLRAGQEVMAGLFPGLLEEMRRDGVVTLDFARDLAWKHHRCWKVRFPSDYESFPQTRPALEDRVRQRVEAEPGVSLLWETDYQDLLFDSAENRVTGVAVRSRGGEERCLDADLVVDATGRGSRTPAWLAAHGFPTPREEEVSIRLAYTTAVCRRPDPYPHDWQALFLPPEPPGIRRGGVILPIDGERWVVTLLGYADDHAPTDPESFLTFARGLSDPAMAHALERAPFLEPPRRFQIPRQVRRHYESLRRFPLGLLVLGDAGCAFDPAFGQGMSAAALEAQALAELLERRAVRREPLRGLPRAFHRRAARVVDTPWALTTMEAYRFPEIEGRRPPGIGLMHRYGAALARAGSRSPALHRVFLRLMHLQSPKELLFHPGVVARVLLDVWWGRRRSARQGRGRAPRPTAALPGQEELAR